MVMENLQGTAGTTGASTDTQNVTNSGTVVYILPNTYDRGEIWYGF
jgi:hypothetical protein